MLHYFCLALALCHDVLAVPKNKDNTRQQFSDLELLGVHHEADQSKEEGEEDRLIGNCEELEYHGMSPDEITLANTAKLVGYEFRYRSNREVVIQLNGTEQRYNLLNVFMFNSERKRMSIVVQADDDPSNVVLFTKGADDIVQKLADNSVDQVFDFTTVSHFAKRGYRTLLVGMKVIPNKEYQKWKETYDKLNSDDSEKHSVDFDEHIENLEHGLYVLGATALEDKLQDKVPE